MISKESLSIRVQINESKEFSNNFWRLSEFKAVDFYEMTDEID